MLISTKNAISSACIAGMIFTGGCNIQNDMNNAEESSDSVSDNSNTQADANSKEQSPASKSQSDPQQDLKQWLSKMFSQRKQPSDAMPTFPLLGRGAFVTNDNGEITQIDLSFTPVTVADLEKLSELSLLETLNISGMKITNEELTKLDKYSKTLKVLDVSYSQVTNEGLTHLKKHTKLEWLMLYGTDVTEEGANELQEILPDCTIRY